MFKSFIILFLLIIPSFYLYTLAIVPLYYFRNNIINIYYRYCLFILYLFNIKIYVNSNDFFKNKKNCLLISNHLSEIDYFFIFILQSFKNINSKLIFVMKNVLRYIFFSFGWSSFLNNSLFLKRNYEQDKKYLDIKLKNLKKYEENIQILIYPEGYIYTSQKFLENIKFCNDNNIKKYDNLLHPRTKGCNLIQKNLNINTIYDLTIMYDTLSYYDLRFNYCIPNIIKNNIFPKEIYIHVNKYENFILDKDNYNIIFDEKDKIMNQYILDKNKYIKKSKLLKPTFSCLLSFIFIFLLNLVGLYYMLYNPTYTFYIVFFTYILLYIDDYFI